MNVLGLGQLWHLYVTAINSYWIVEGPQEHWDGCSQAYPSITPGFAMEWKWKIALWQGGWTQPSSLQVACRCFLMWEHEQGWICYHCTRAVACFVYILSFLLATSMKNVALHAKPTSCSMVHRAVTKGTEGGGSSLLGNVYRDEKKKVPHTVLAVWVKAKCTQEAGFWIHS